MRPKSTFSVIIAHKLKRKYKQIQHIKSLKTQCQVGRPRMDARIQDRVGRKVAKLCKVLYTYYDINSILFTWFITP